MKNLTVYIVTFVNPTAEEGREIYGVYENENSARMSIENLYAEECCDELDPNDFIDEWQVIIEKHEVEVCK